MSSSSTVDIITCVVPGLVVCQCLYDVVSLYKLCQLELSMSFNGWFTESLNSCTKNNYRHTFPKVENRLTLDRIISSLNVFRSNGIVCKCSDKRQSWLLNSIMTAYTQWELMCLYKHWTILHVMYTWVPTVYMLSWCCLIIDCLLSEHLHYYFHFNKRCHVAPEIHLMMKWYDQGWVYFLLLGKSVSIIIFGTGTLSKQQIKDSFRQSWTMLTFFKRLQMFYLIL